MPVTLRILRRHGVLVTATVLLLALWIARRVDPLPAGLQATYTSAGDRTSIRRLTTIDPQPSAEALERAWRGHPPAAFGATWTGALLVLHQDNYTFATASDGGSALYIDGHLVVDNDGRRGSQPSRGALPLERGVHRVLATYARGDGPVRLELSWARGAAPLEPVPGWALSPRHATFPRLVARMAVVRAWPAAGWLWLGLLAFVAAASPRGFFMRRIRGVAADPARRALMFLIAGSLVLNVVGIWWGLPSTWAGDEFTPKSVFLGLGQRFSAGWFDRYPPLHFYVLSVAFAPWELVKSLGGIQVADRANDAVLLFLARLVSIAAATGTLVAVYICGKETFGQRAGFYAAAMTAILCPLVYYAKTANPEVPYVFWFAVSLVFYMRVLRTLSVKNAALFAAAAMLAICTKDQAYALYLSVPFVMAFHVWRANRHAGLSHPLARTLVDRRLLVAGATGAAVFVVCHNLAFNAAGFMQHVRDITGPGSQPYRMVPLTLAGRLDLLWQTLALDQVSWGWPMTMVTLGGVGVAATDSQVRGAALCLALVAVGYYLGFINVVLYVYDRYLLPVCIVQALLGGVALERFLRWPHPASQIWRRALVAAAFTYTLLYAATVDALMLRDSRYDVERWLHTHVGPGELIGTTFPPYVLPRLAGLRFEDISTIEDLRRLAPVYYVLNADYARAIEPGRALRALTTGLQQQTLEYRLAYRERSPAPWPWLPASHPDLTGPRLDGKVLSVLRDINPTMEVYVREPGGAGR